MLKNVWNKNLIEIPLFSKCFPLNLINIYYTEYQSSVISESMESIDRSRKDPEDDEWLNFLSGTKFDEVIAKCLASN